MPADLGNLRQGELRAALLRLGLTGPAPVLILVGGAANLDPGVARPLLDLFGSCLPLLEALDAVLIDGGTDVGVMALLGQARQHAGARLPLLGVAATGTVALDGRPMSARVAFLSQTPSMTPPDLQNIRDEGGGGRARLDPHHSHFLLVPGDRWGDESGWICATAAALAADRPILTLVAGGGDITALDVTNCLRAGQPLLILAGTGGTADRVADGWRHGRPIPGIALGPAECALIEVLDLTDAAARLPDILRRRLGP